MPEKELRQDLFFVQRNTNRNEVHYSIRYDADSLKPVAHEPIVGYWKMLEKGPDVTEPITLFELAAYGIISQKITGNEVTIKLRALPEREILICPEPGAAGTYAARISIANQSAILTHFYAHAVPGFLLPKVAYVDVFGQVDGKPVSERIAK
jgi:hypothetical protein